MQLRSFPESYTNYAGQVILRDSKAVGIPDEDITFLHYHNLCELGMCRCGSGLWMVGDSVTAIHPGDIMIVPPGVHHYSREVDKGCRCEFIYFDEEQLLEVCGIQASVSKRLPKNYPSVIRDENTRFILRSMIETRDVAESALWYALFLKRLPEDNLLPELPEDEQLAPAMQRILLSYAEPLTVADLAAECGLCPSWFAKQFKKEYGSTPIEFLNKFRVKVAIQLLRGNLSITDVAARSGFGSPSDLYRHFMKECGCPPSEFRKIFDKK